MKYILFVKCDVMCAAEEEFAYCSVFFHSINFLNSLKSMHLKQNMSYMLDLSTEYASRYFTHHCQHPLSRSFSESHSHSFLKRIFLCKIEMYLIGTFTLLGHNSLELLHRHSPVRVGVIAFEGCLQKLLILSQIRRHISYSRFILRLKQVGGTKDTGQNPHVTTLYYKFICQKLHHNYTKL